MGKRVALALGSGGARGWAHIGVIRALEEAGIPIDYVAGTSIGAFVGSIYAVGALDELERFVAELDWRAIVSLLDVEFPTQGLLDGGKIYNLLYGHLLERQIEDTQIPFACVATDLQSQAAVTFQTGSVVDAVRASISIPGVFTPHEHEGQFFVDGGVVNPVPVNVAQEMGGDIVIAVNLNYPHPDTEAKAQRSETVHPDDPPQRSGGSSDPEMEPVADTQAAQDAATMGESPTADLPKQSADDETESSGALNAIAAHSKAALPEQAQDLLLEVRSRYDNVRNNLSQKISRWLPEKSAEEAESTPSAPNIFDVIGGSINIMEQQVTQIQLKVTPPDVLLQPRLGQYGIFDFHQAEALIAEGYRCAQASLSEIRQQLDQETEE
jgi:NTE family protein